MLDWSSVSFPRRLTAAALFLNAKEEILIVRPSDRADDTWFLPGGTVEREESPLQACRRELREELGLDLQLQELLCVEYHFTIGRHTESLHFVFHGGHLSEPQIEAIRLPPDEIAEYSFCPRTDALERLLPTISARVRVALRALQERRTIYLENGIEVGAWPAA